jgi:hypothetical protein
LPARTGSRWSSPLGQIQIETFRLHEASLPALFDDEKRTAQRRASVSILNSDSFFIAGEQKLKKFVERAQSSGGEVRGVTVLYDQATEGTMAPIAMAITDTFTGFPNPAFGSSADAPRGVEYATAIVVGSRGELVAPASATQDCQSITVPGFGHAERVAEDLANNLALLRLYGARSLVPATFTGDATSGDALILYGVANPGAKAADATVTRITAQLTDQGVEPAPQPGFAGAAAIDSQGRFAGIVTPKSAAGAAAPSLPAQPAALVPAAAVRHFLQSQNVVPASAGAAMDLSVVRVICVRP